MGKKRNKAKKFVSTSSPARAIRILLADDKKSIREVISEFLEFIGYDVSHAINGIEALAVFLEKSFDLVLTDLEMPVMDGLSLAGHIKAKSPGTPVILLTGSDRATVLEIGKGLFDSVLLKPFLMEDLQSVIQIALASRERKQEGIGGGVMPEDILGSLEFV